MTKMILLTLVTAVVLIEGCFGVFFTVKCYSKTVGMDRFTSSMVKLNGRGLPVLDTVVFDVVPNTAYRPINVQFNDSREGVTHGCQMELLVKQAEGFNLTFKDRNKSNPDFEFESEIDVGITINNDDWLDDLPLLAIAMYRPNAEFTPDMCNQNSLFKDDTWTKYFANTYSYLPNKIPDSDSLESNVPVVGSVTEDELDQKIIQLINNVEFPRIKPGVLFVPTDKTDPTSNFVSDEDPVEINKNNYYGNNDNRDFYCAMMPPIQEEIDNHDLEVQHGEDQKEAMRREAAERKKRIEQGLDPDFENDRLLLV